MHFHQNCFLGICSGYSIDDYGYDGVLPASVSLQLPPRVSFYTNPVGTNANHVGSIIFDNLEYANAAHEFYPSDSYTSSASPAPSYVFDHWEYGGGVQVSNGNANPVSVLVSGNGWLKADFGARITFRTYPSTVGSVAWDGCSGPSHPNYDS